MRKEATGGRGYTTSPNSGKQEKRNIKSLLMAAVSTSHFSDKCLPTLHTGGSLAEYN